MNCEEYAAWARRLNPIDDALFKKMAEDMDFCQEIIRVVLGDPDLQVIELKNQDTVQNLQGRSVILDARCVDHLGNHITVEVQKSDKDDHQRRIRYNSSCVTANITDPGSNFKDVPTLYAIYISANDFFGKGKTTYHIDRILRETGDVVDNGFYEIYVNARIKDGSPTAELMDIFIQDDTYDEKQFPATSRRKRQFKEGQEEFQEMSSVMDEFKEYVITLDRRQLILAMYHDGEITLHTACKRLNLSEEEFLALEAQE
ncbi:MAG: Rpn family recombination-promoting nuclease/putative transposase [Lachnospiraceae bacterium]|nr:Rpn family recombination-promoting nuclease/putative transposase [Lachnospiraceae bacterium]